MRLNHWVMRMILLCLLVYSFSCPVSSSFAFESETTTSTTENINFSEIKVTNGLITVPFYSIPERNPKIKQFTLSYTQDSETHSLSPLPAKWEESTRTFFIPFKPFQSTDTEQEITIRIGYEDSEPTERSIVLASKDSEVESIEILNTWGNSELQLRDSNDREAKLLAVAKDSEGAIVAYDKVTWASENPRVASVTSLGRVWAKKAGTAEITATIAGKTETYQIDVVSKQQVPTAISKDGEFGPESGVYKTSGTIEIKGKGTTVLLRNTKLDGDLVIDNGGSVTLDNVHVSGEIKVKDVASNSLHVNHVSADRLVITDGNGARLVLEDEVELPEVEVSAQSTQFPVVIEGKAANNSTLQITSPSWVVVDSVVSKVVVDKDAEGTRIETTKESKIDVIEANASASVEGSGTIDKLVLADSSVNVKSEVNIPTVVYANEPATPTPPTPPTPPANQAPVASQVTISGTFQAGETLTGSYVYTDAENNPERLSLFKWYRGSLSDGSDKVQISGANKKTYVLQQDDVGKHVTFEVTPIASTGTRSGVPATYTSTQTVTNVPAANNSPVINSSYTAQTFKNTLASGTVAATDLDGDTITYLLGSTPPAHGTVVVLPSGAWTYTPQAAFTGTDSFSIVADDGRGGTAATVVSITVTEDPLEADRQALTIGYASGDDADHVTQNVVLATTGANGSLISWSSDNPAVIAQDGTVTRPQAIEQDATVTLTATITTGSRSNTKSFVLTVLKQAAQSNNQPPTAIGTISNQTLLPGSQPYPQIDLSTIFADPDNDALQYQAATTAQNIVQTTVNGNMLSLAPIGKGVDTVTVTANDGKGGTKDVTFTAHAYEFVAGGQVTIRTKSGVMSVQLDLNQYFPNAPVNSLQILNNGTGGTVMGTKLQLIPASVPGSGLWVANQSDQVALIKVDIQQQGQPQLFFSDYVYGTDGRNALQLFFQGDSSGYVLEVHRFKTDTQQKATETYPLPADFPAREYIIIDEIFYDFMDITPATYFNLDINMSIQGYVTAFVLKKDGQIVDVLGNPDPNNRSPILAETGTIVRKSGIYTGSQSFSLEGEWDIYPAGYYQSMGRHNP
ncbi:hypothetical protein AV540_00815 [Brevibacillus parabrevis]|uniref:immunoglobulin-like domain-containing protein n=1 Tax=Brevibacillus parabrevis TaxID=54914 RepID=UPI0007AB8F8A|nr:immunoglobulin-like domain-containing protein [Brevibacillus parabrevis]KZE48134.1 hypothetical protein AV540_00815 [Brevibacillus parabrevis]